MSLTRDAGNIVFECDNCHETLETGTSNFDEARQVLENDEWRWRRFPGSSDFKHFCQTSCKAEFEGKR